MKCTAPLGLLAAGAALSDSAAADSTAQRESITQVLNDVVAMDSLLVQLIQTDRHPGSLKHASSNLLSTLAEQTTVAKGLPQLAEEDTSAVENVASVLREAGGRFVTDFAAAKGLFERAGYCGCALDYVMKLGPLLCDFFHAQYAKFPPGFQDEAQKHTSGAKIELGNLAAVLDPAHCVNSVTAEHGDLMARREVERRDSAAPADGSPAPGHATTTDQPTETDPPNTTKLAPATTTRATNTNTNTRAAAGGEPTDSAESLGSAGSGDASASTSIPGTGNATIITKTIHETDGFVNATSVSTTDAPPSSTHANYTAPRVPAPSNHVTDGDVPNTNGAGAAAGVAGIVSAGSLGLALAAYMVYLG